MARAKTEAIRLAEIQAREKDKDRVVQVLTNPNVARVGLLAGLLFGCRAIRDTAGKDNMGYRDIACAVGTVGTLLLAADAGITDKWALGLIAAGAGLSLGEGRSGIVALGPGAWESDALVRVDPTQFSSIFGG